MSSLKMNAIKIIGAVQLSFLLGLPSGFASASGLGCELNNRMSTFFSDKLPQEVQARISCSQASLKLKDLYVAKIASVERSKLISWFKLYEAARVPEAHKTLLIHKSGTTAENTWLEFESELENGERITHYLFTAPAPNGKAFVFLYTDKSKNARNQSGRIRTLMKAFRDKEYLKAIDQSLWI